MATYYDAEAAVYDESRGGTARAVDAARAVDRLVGPGRLLVDVAGGTGIVAAELDRLGHRVVVLDESRGMLEIAAGRLPGRVLAGGAQRLPLRDASVEAVSTVWLLHLLDVATADAVVVEVARVLGDDGVWVTTVDKNQSHGRSGAPADDRDRVTALAGRLGLEPAGEERFRGASAWGSATREDPVFTVRGFRRPRR